MFIKQMSNRQKFINNKRLLYIECLKQHLNILLEKLRNSFEKLRDVLEGLDCISILVVVVSIWKIYIFMKFTWMYSISVMVFPITFNYINSMYFSKFLQGFLWRHISTYSRRGGGNISQLSLRLGSSPVWFPAKSFAHKFPVNIVNRY